MKILTLGTKHEVPNIPVIKRARFQDTSLGFSLLELLLVLAIISITVALVLPRINNLDSRTFQAELRKGVTVLNYARRAAIVKSSPQSAIFLHINTDLGKERKEYDSNTALWGSEDINFSFSQSQGQSEINKLQASVEIIFYPEGGSTGGVLTFMQEDMLGTITINAITGRVSSSLTVDTEG